MIVEDYINIILFDAGAFASAFFLPSCLGVCNCAHTANGNWQLKSLYIFRYGNCGNFPHGRRAVGGI